MNGWIILDKPSGITSAHAVAKVKRLLISLSLRERVAAKPPGEGSTTQKSPHPNPLPLGEGVKIGHAGTLDPLASGILPLALGEATKTVSYMVDASKAYEFTVAWGEERDTDDSEGKTVKSSDKRPPPEEIMAILPQFIGNIQQTPPDYSAIKVDGKRSYDMARQGETVGLKSREVRVDSLTLSPPPQAGEGIRMSETSFLCHCSKGTYIRSLARDMGRILGCFGHISRLRRTRVGKFDQAHAISLEMLENMVHKGDLGFLKPVESALDDIPAVNITDDQAAQLKRGQNVVLPLTECSTMLARCNGKLIAICECKESRLKPVRVFNL